MDASTWKTKLIKVPVSKLKLWLDNPRLSSEIKPQSDTEYADIFIQNNDEQDDFINLISSIAEKGFEAYSIVMLWKQDKELFVAEGNRRIVAIRLLLKPSIAPNSIRKKVEQYAAKANLSALKSIHVIIAPDFESAEWHINQQNNFSSLKKPWARRSQVKWIYDTYYKHNQDIDITTAQTEMKKGDAYKAIRLHKIFQFMDNQIVVERLGQDQHKKASSYLFPVTALERFILMNETQQKWGIEYKNADVNIKSNRTSFLMAFAELIKLILNGERDTRNLNKKDVSELLLENRFQVSFEVDPTIESLREDITNFSDSNQDNTSVAVKPEVHPQPDLFHGEMPTKKDDKPPVTKPRLLENDPARKTIIPKSLRKPTTNNPRLNNLFEELKNLEIDSHENCVAACLRVLLDLSVWEYIKVNKISQNIVDSVTPKPSSIHLVTLDKKIEYLSKHLSSESAKKIAAGIRDKKNNGSYTLEVLNAYVHGPSNHYIEKQFLNKFWDYLYPLFEELIKLQKKEKRK